MNDWPTIREGYSDWLRAFPLMTRIGLPGSEVELIAQGDEAVYRPFEFWSERSHEAEAIARKHLTDLEIDGIFDEITSVIDEDLSRFDPLIAYYGRFFEAGDPVRIDLESDAAADLKRDLAWAAIERSVGNPAFFTSLIPWYAQGRWPVDWSGNYPQGRVMVL